MRGRGTYSAHLTCGVTSALGANAPGPSPNLSHAWERHILRSSHVRLHLGVWARHEWTDPSSCLLRMTRRRLAAGDGYFFGVADVGAGEIGLAGAGEVFLPGAGSLGVAGDVAVADLDAG